MILPLGTSHAATRYDGDGIVIPICEVLRWYANRARFKPEAEADRLGLTNSTSGGHPNYDVCEDTSGANDFGTTPAQWASWQTSMQPLAPNELIRRAASNHCEEMFSPGPFQHDTPPGSAYYPSGWSGTQREAYEGYTNNCLGMLENIIFDGLWSSGGYPANCGYTPEQWHEGGWFVDNSQADRSHRKAILNTDAREIGIGYCFKNKFESPNMYWTFEYATEDFGYRGSDRFFTDTIFYDTDADKAYDRGEGIGSVEIRLYDGTNEASWYDVSGVSGSFAVPTKDLATGHTINVVLVNKTGASKTITIPTNYLAQTNIGLANNQSYSLGTYVQGTTNAGFRNLKMSTNLTITATAGAGGSISPAGSVSVALGSSKTFTISPDLSCYISNVFVDGVSAGAVSSYTFTNVTANHSITALFGVPVYAIAATASTGGTISPSGTVSVTCGNSQTFTITSGMGYRIANVVVDAVSQGATSSYTFVAVTNNHSISASFMRITNNIPGTVEAEDFSNEYGIGTEITTDTGGGLNVGWTDGGDWMDYNVNVATAGTYTCSFRIAGVVTGQLQVQKSDATVLATVDTPNTGWWQTWATATSSVFHLSGGVQTLRVYVLAAGWNLNWCRYHFLTADQFEITATAATGGTISPSGAVSVANGNSQGFAIAPNTGYNITNVLVDGISVGAVASYTFTNVTYNRTIAASFGPSPDADNDGMNDSWEILYFLSTNAANGGPQEDKDGDGISNLKEYIAGTDPTNDASSLAVDILSFGTSIEVGVNTLLTSSNYYGTSTRHYKIEEVSDLFGTWTSSTGYADFPATGQARILTNSAPDLSRFYRVKAWLVP